MPKNRAPIPEADAVIFTTEEGVKSWNGRAVFENNKPEDMPT